MNIVHLSGNLTGDFDTRYTHGGTQISSVNIANNKVWKDQQGNKQEKPIYIKLVFMGAVAERAVKYLSKGKKVLIEGELDFNKWEHEGRKYQENTIKVKNFHFMGCKDNDNQNGYQDNRDYSQYQANETAINTPPSYGEPQHNAPTQQTKQQIPEIDIDEDEIPF